MKKYCFDTSGLSRPLLELPEDLHTNIWRQVRDFIRSGQVAVTPEIYSEMAKTRGDMGHCILQNKEAMVLDVYELTWDWESYIQATKDLMTRYQPFISEYNGNVKKTVGVVDISIIALAKSLNLPLVSMEESVTSPGNESARKRRIPDICRAESITHQTFNEFLRLEGIHG